MRALLQGTDGQTADVSYEERDGRVTVRLMSRIGQHELQFETRKQAATTCLMWHEALCAVGRMLGDDDGGES